MANAREIQTRMKSIQDTLKITNAMYMISSSKMKRAKQKLADTEPYFYTLQSAIGRLLRHIPDMEHLYFDTVDRDKDKAERRIGYIVVTADKGLAGSYNHNVIKMAQEHLNQYQNEYTRLFVVGELGRQYFIRKNIDVDTHFQYTVQKPTMSRARVISEKMLDLYKSGELDEIYMIFTKMENAVSSEAEFMQLLPLKREEFHYGNKLPADVYMESFSFYPSTEAIMDSVIPNYIAGFIYGALVESYSSEHNARMMAMEAASKSANKMLQELSVEYNRVRQAAITQELTEVIAGAKSQKRKRKH